MNSGYKVLLSFSPKEINVMSSFRSLSRFINADSYINARHFCGIFFLFFSFLNKERSCREHFFGKTCILKNGDAFRCKKQERMRMIHVTGSTLFLKWSRKEKKSRDERRHESVMDRERVKEETASRGDRERDRERQERERERERERDRETVGCVK